MARIIKRIIIYTLILIVLGFGVILGYIWLKNDNAEKLNAANAELEYYMTIYEPLGEIYTGYCVISDERYGKKITEEDLTQVEIPENCLSNAVTDIDEIVGKYYRINVSAGTVISKDLIMDFPQTSDERAFDVITKFNPIGLEPNDFVDIRFSLPSGEDYVALSHKRVEGVYSGILKLMMSEYDIMVYNSLLVDQILFKGSVVYATKYVEPGGQYPAAENYPLSLEILNVLLRNKNTSKDVSYDIVVRERTLMENAYNKYAEDEIKKALLETGKNEIPGLIQNGDNEYRVQKEIEEQKRIEEEILNGR